MALLIGNFGDGKINGFDPTTGALLGTISDSMGNPIVNPGLWGLRFGNSNPTFDSNSLYFTAGGADEGSGVFGRLSSVPEPGSLILGFLALRGFSPRGGSRIAKARRPLEDLATQRRTKTYTPAPKTVGSAAARCGLSPDVVR